MPTGFINAIVRRATLKRILLCLAGLAIMAAAVVPALNYYRNILSGPFEVTGKDLDAITDINSLDNYFFAVHDDEAFDTESATVWSYVGIEMYRDKYTVISLGDQLLLVETSRDPNSLDYSGALKEIPPGLQRDLIDEAIREYPELKDAFFPFMLDEGMMGSTFRLFGFITIGIVATIFGWLLLVLRRTVQWIAEPSKHPIMLALARYGEPKLVGDQIERELQMEQEFLRKIYLTRNWVVYRGRTRLEVARLNDIMWVYPYTYTHYVNGIPVYRTHEAYIWDRHGAFAALPCRKKDIPAIMQAILRRAPWAVAGFSPQLHNLWLNNRNDFISDVERRRQDAQAA